jgi:hypothetical protein
MDGCIEDIYNNTRTLVLTSKEQIFGQAPTKVKWPLSGAFRTVCANDIYSVLKDLRKKPIQGKELPPCVRFSKSIA